MNREVGLKARKVICSCDPQPMTYVLVTTPPSDNPGYSLTSAHQGEPHSMPSLLVPDKIEDELELTMVCHEAEGLEQLFELTSPRGSCKSFIRVSNVSPL